MGIDASKKPMTLEQVRDDIRHQEVYVGGVTIHPSIFKKWADAIDARLAREVRVTDVLEMARVALHRSAPIREAIDHLDKNAVANHQKAYQAVLTAIESSGASLPVAAKVPDALKQPPIVLGDEDSGHSLYVDGWNACREAMIAQGNGEGKP